MRASAALLTLLLVIGTVGSAGAQRLPDPPIISEVVVEGGVTSSQVAEVCVPQLASPKGTAGGQYSNSALD